MNNNDKKTFITTLIFNTVVFCCTLILIIKGMITKDTENIFSYFTTMVLLGNIVYLEYHKYIKHA
jgi:hypothetical protein